MADLVSVARGGDASKIQTVIDELEKEISDISQKLDELKSAKVTEDEILSGKTMDGNTAKIAALENTLALRNNQRSILGRRFEEAERREQLNTLMSRRTGIATRAKEVSAIAGRIDKHFRAAAEELCKLSGIESDAKAFNAAVERREECDAIETISISMPKVWTPTYNCPLSITDAEAVFLPNLRAYSHPGPDQPLTHWPVPRQKEPEPEKTAEEIAWERKLEKRRRASRLEVMNGRTSYRGAYAEELAARGEDPNLAYADID